MLSNSWYNYKTKKGYHFYYRYCDKLKNDIKQNLGYDIKNNTNVTAPSSFYQYHDSKNLMNVISEIKNHYIQICYSITIR